jgi:uncharacterized membrane protein YdbT with pleckstrin-like domain
MVVVAVIVIVVVVVVVVVVLVVVVVHKCCRSFRLPRFLSSRHMNETRRSDLLTSCLYPQ